MKKQLSGKDGGYGLGERAEMEDFGAIVVSFECKVLGVVLKENNGS